MKATEQEIKKAARGAREIFDLIPKGAKKRVAEKMGWAPAEITTNLITGNRKTLEPYIKYRLCGIEVAMEIEQEAKEAKNEMVQINIE